jgi:predicted DNA-binding transcriptional regulator YafY
MLQDSSLSTGAPAQGGGGPEGGAANCPGGARVERTERFYRIIRLLESRRSVPRDVFSRATFKRDLEYLIDRLNAPIIYDRSLGGYRLDGVGPNATRFELPGAWFNASEAHALLTAHVLLDRLQPGLLTPFVNALAVRIRALLGSGDHSAEEVRRRIRVLAQGARPVPAGQFETISSGILERRRLRIRYFSRGRNEESERIVSPQRLVHYRDNWYLDAWCHLRDALRVFALDCVHAAERLDEKAREVPDAELDRVLGAGYGIFSGAQTETAVLRFSPEHARWVAAERWHPEQKGHFEEDGYYLLELPFSDPRELVMDIMRHGAGVEVLSPFTLRQAVGTLLADAAALYR